MHGDVGEEGGEGGVSPSVLLTMRLVHVEFSLAPMGHRKQPNGSCTIIKFENRSKSNTCPIPPIIRFPS